MRKIRPTPVKAAYMAMGFWLSLFSGIWFVASTYLVLSLSRKEEYAVAAFSFAMSILSFGLWARWRWVKGPLIAYWCMVAAAAAFLAITETGWSFRAAGQVGAPLYFVWLIFRWRPDLWPRTTIVV